MKDYSHLKGTEVEVIPTDPSYKYKNCIVVQISDKGLSVMGTLIKSPNLNSEHMNQEIKVYCLMTELETHKLMFPYAIKAIENGVIDTAKIREEANTTKAIEASESLMSIIGGGGEPNCAFE